MIRLTGLRHPQGELEARLGKLGRYEPEQSYAQLDISSPTWDAISRVLHASGPEIQKLSREAPGFAAALDIAFSVGPDIVGATRNVPAETAALAGRYGIALDITFYAASQDRN